MFQSRVHVCRGRLGGSLGLFLMGGLLLVAWAGRAAPPVIRCGGLRVQPIGAPGRWTGFSCTTASGWSFPVTFGSGASITARTVRRSTRDGVEALRFEGLRAGPTPTLAADSFVEVQAAPGFRFVQVRFRLHLAAFDEDAWRERMGEVPFHFMVCRQESAGIFHQRGWPIPTPVLDPYPLLSKSTGYGIQIRSLWSKNWTYAPPVGAYPVPVVGLWTPEKGRYVAYDFHGARLSDHSARDIGTAYCWKFKDTGRFFCLVWPYARPYQKLRFPRLPDQAVVDSRFHLLYSEALYSDDDPNLFVQQFAWRHWADLFPGAPRVNDLSWLPPQCRLSDFPVPGIGRLYYRVEKARWWKKGTIDLGGGTWTADAVTFAFESGRTDAIRRLRQDVEFMLQHVRRFVVDGDECAAWQKPIRGEAVDMFGPDGVPTLHNIQTWQIALIFLDLCRNDPSLRSSLLPVVDGVLRWTKHVLYTRNGYPDVPAAQFCWGAGPVTTFCLRYYFTFRDDAQRRDLARSAFKLARTMLYRYLPIWLSDSNEADTLDSSFFMEPNSGISWLGAACSNEVWVLPLALTQVYVHTGDPLLAHCVRGMLERWHMMYRDEYAPRIEDYTTNFTERYGLYDGSVQAPGTRASFGGLWGGSEQLIWPVADARARFVCGEKAALAFNRDGRHTDLAEYRWCGNGDFSLRVVPYGPRRAQLAAPFSVCVTCPFFDLRKKPVQILRGGRRIPVESGDGLVRFAARPDSLLIRGVRYGDVIAVGNVDLSAPVLPCPVQRVRSIPADDLTAGPFRCRNLAQFCDAGLPRAWSDPKSWAGLPAGRRFFLGVPFLIPDPDLNGGRNIVSNRRIPLSDFPADDLFLLLVRIRPDARIILDPGMEVDASRAPAILKGWPPCFEWTVHMLHIPIQGRSVRTVYARNCDILALTSAQGAAETVRKVRARLDALAEKEAEERARIAAVAALKPDFERLQGKVAILPMPKGLNPYGSPVVKALHKAGLMPFVHVLTPEEFVDPDAFNPERYPAALYLSGENYRRTVRREGDGDEALLRFLDAGGTLIVLPAGPFPFYYDEKGNRVVAAHKFGLPICGSGLGDVRDAPEWSRLHGWEKPPQAHTFHFEVASQAVRLLAGVPARFPFPSSEIADQRWRPVVPSGKEARYLPLITLKDETGASWGDGAAVIERPAKYGGTARIIYVWTSLLQTPQVGGPLLVGVLKYALANALPPVARTVCLRTSQPPKIDGRLDDRIWSVVPPLDLAHTFLTHSGRPEYRTTARVCWDAQNLYLAFECEDPDIWSDLRNRDDFLWEGEVVEFYIDPDGDGKFYKEFEVNPRNALIDLNIERLTGRGVPLEDVKRFVKWNAAGIRTAVTVDGTPDNRTDQDRRWCVEVAVPLRNFADSARVPPRIGDTWRIQLYRIDRSRELEKPEFSAWSPTTTFHYPERFGVMTFGGPAAEDDFSLYPEGAPPGPPWQVLSGTWRVHHGELVGKNSGTDGWRAEGVRWGCRHWRDYRLTVRFKIESVGSDWRDGPWFGVRCRGGDGWFVNFGTRDVQLHKSVGGRDTNDAHVLAGAPWKPDGTWHTVDITVRGNRIEVVLDGKRVLFRIDDDGLAGMPPPDRGAVMLSARRWSGSKGATRIRYAFVRVAPLP